MTNKEVIQKLRAFTTKVEAQEDFKELISDFKMDNGGSIAAIQEALVDFRTSALGDLPLLEESLEDKATQTKFAAKVKALEGAHTKAVQSLKAMDKAFKAILSF
jgi:hypothetical protein